MRQYKFTVKITGDEMNCGHLREKRNACTIFELNPAGWRPVGRFICGYDWIQVARDGEQ
jgi:hypothetical protein